MSARNQLNTIYVYVILIIAAFIAITFGSWTLFVVIIPVMLGIALLDGSIRLNPDLKKRPGRKRRR